MSSVLKRGWVATVLMGLVIGGLSAGAPAAADVSTQVLPGPFAFVSRLDLECFRTNLYVPPTTTVVTQHLNPVLAHLPVETHVLGAREQLCVPVAKNNMIPPAGVVDFIRWVDLSCYRIQGANVNFPLNLRHLNPLFQTLPPKNVVITVPQQLCLPVIKNGLMPPAEVLSLVRYIDLKCYAEQPNVSLGATVNLRHLNPLFSSSLAAHNAGISFNRQLCVPVRKNNQPIPAAVFNIIRWIDLEKYDIVTPSLNPPVNLNIKHINPSLAGLPIEPVTMQLANQLMLPVAKNNMIPPTS